MSLRRLSAAPCLVFFVFALAAGPTRAQECIAIKGAFLAKKDDKWEPLKAGAPIPKDRLLVSLFDTDVRSANGAVEVKLVGGIGEFGPLPAFESAVQFHENAKVDLDITLQRGIVVLVNAKKEGPAQADLRIRGKTIAVTLGSPGSKLGVDLYSRHAPGLAALKADDPTVFVFMLNVQGSAQVTCDGRAFTLKAPPGPALLRWDSAVREADVQHLDALPDWAKPNPAEYKIHEQINREAKALGEGKARDAFLKMLFSDDPIVRKVGLTAVGALGTPAPLFVALQKSKHADARQFAILVVRNWLGQDAGQIKKMEAAFMGLGLTKTDTESLMNLLLGFDDDERQRPATYQLLIEGLKHSKLLVRELSYWHLVRMAPAGRSIAYDPTGTPEAIDAGVAQWRELIPAGQMPPAPKK